MADYTISQYTYNDVIKEQNAAKEAEAQRQAKNAAAEKQLQEQSLFMGVNKENFAKNINIFESGKSWGTEFSELGSGILDAPSGIFNIFGSILKAGGQFLGGVGNAAGQASVGLQQPKQQQRQQVGQTSQQGVSGQQGGAGQTVQTSTPSSTGSTTSSAKAGSTTAAISQNMKDGAVRVTNGNRDTSIATFGLEDTNSSVKAAVEEYNQATDDVSKFKGEVETAYKELQTAKEKNKGEVNQHYANSQAAQAKADYLSSKISDLDADITGQQRILDGLNSAEKKDTDRITQMENSIARLKTQRDNLKTQKEAAETEAAKEKAAAGELKDADKTITTAQAKYDSAKAKYETAQNIQTQNKTNVETAVKDVMGKDFNASGKPEDVKAAVSKHFTFDVEAAKKQTEEESKVADKAETETKANEKNKFSNAIIKDEATQAVSKLTDADVKAGKTPDKPALFKDMSDADWKQACDLAKIALGKEKTESTGTTTTTTSPTTTASSEPTDEQLVAFELEMERNNYKKEEA